MKKRICKKCGCDLQNGFCVNCGNRGEGIGDLFKGIGVVILVIIAISSCGLIL